MHVRRTIIIEISSIKKKSEIIFLKSKLQLILAYKINVKYQHVNSNPINGAFFNIEGLVVKGGGLEIRKFGITKNSSGRV